MDSRLNNVELFAIVGMFATGVLHAFLMMFFPGRWAACPRLLAWRGYVGAPDGTIRIAGFALLVAVACFAVGAAGLRMGPITASRPVDWAWALMVFMGLGGR